MIWNTWIDLERKSGLVTEKNESKRKDGHDTDQKRTEGDETPKKETQGWTWSERKSLKRKGMIWNEKGWLGRNNGFKCKKRLLGDATNKPMTHQIYKSFWHHLKDNTGMKLLFRYRKYTTWRHVRWHSNATGSSHAPVHMACCATWSSHARMHWYTWCSGNNATVWRFLNSCAVASILDATVLEIHVQWQTLHYGMWSSCALAHKLDVALLDVPMHWHNSLMLRYLKFMCAGKHTWCYARLHVLVDLMLRYLKCMYAGALHATLLEVHVRLYAWWYATWVPLQWQVYLLLLCLQVSRRHKNVKNIFGKRTVCYGTSPFKVHCHRTKAGPS